MLKTNIGIEHRLDVIKQTRKRRPVAVMLVVYGDESMDEQRERIFAIGVLIGTQEQWDLLELIWKDITKGKIFHASDCECGYGDYKGIDPEERLNEFKNLTQLLVLSKIKGLGLVMDLDAYHTLFPDSDETWPYMRCFSRLIAAVGRLVTESGYKESVKFVFDRNFDTRHNSSLLYDIMLKSTDCAPYIKNMAEEVATATRKTIGIQAADLWAREIMKYCDSRIVGDKSIPIRKSIKALSDSKNFFFEFQHKEYFEDMLESFNDGRLEQRTGMKPEDYPKWINENNLIDNPTNKLRYLEHLESKNGISSRF